MNAILEPGKYVVKGYFYGRQTKTEFLNSVRLSCMYDRFDSGVDCQGHDCDPDGCYEPCETCTIGKYIAFKDFGVCL